MKRVPWQPHGVFSKLEARCNEALAEPHRAPPGRRGWITAKDVQVSAKPAPRVDESMREAA